ncbi:Cytosine/adenosine deaminase [Bifidobacterium commune]|uniref:Cytosine/adenosine deaminase n=2 Tax=Bifidobacterium commune TaxID=1505727 RepID=A0A1C4H442_9BIFI|nr:Cytosine/adenosine deaminase [Bifidobacterium commune]
MMNPDSPLRDTSESHDTNDKNIYLYSAKLVIPVTAPVIGQGAVAVRGKRVLHVGTRAWVLRELREEGIDPTEVIERYFDGIIMPGLVNAHTHLQYTGMQDVGQGHYPDFHSWEQAFDVVYSKAEHTKPWKEWASDGARRLVESGTTAAADVVTDIEAAGALASQGLHGITYWEVMNWRNADWQNYGKTALKESLSQIKTLNPPNIGISPHAPYTLDSEPFIDLPDIARSLNMRLHIHLGETPMEAGSHPAILSTYTAKDWNDDHWPNYRELKKQGKGASAIQFVDKLGSLGPDVHIAHGVWANREDRRILRQRGVSVALCPRSNEITHTGKEAPVRDYMDEGNMLSIGTDSLSSSPSLDLFDEAAIVYDMARKQGYTHDDLSHRIIRMMTLGGAESMGLHIGTERIGQINAGSLADLSFIDIPPQTETPEQVEHTLDELIRDGSGHNKATIISGHVIYNDGAFEAI